MSDYWACLGLKSGATLNEVEQAYRELVQVWHPDRFPSNPKLKQKAELKMREINIAYEGLLQIYKSNGASSSVQSNPSYNTKNNSHTQSQEESVEDLYARAKSAKQKHSQDFWKNQRNTQSSQANKQTLTSLLSLSVSIIVIWNFFANIHDFKKFIAVFLFTALGTGWLMFFCWFIPELKKQGWIFESFEWKDLSLLSKAKFIGYLVGSFIAFVYIMSASADPGFSYHNVIISLVIFATAIVVPVIFVLLVQSN